MITIPQAQATRYLMNIGDGRIHSKTQAASDTGTFGSSRDSGLGLVSLGLLLLICAGNYAVSLANSDFWWHIAAGRDILQQAALPLTDPFGEFPAADAIRNDTVLKGQWLGQVVLYGLFEAGGVNAVVVFRVVVLLTCVALVFVHARLLGVANPLHQLIGGIRSSMGYTGCATLDEMRTKPEFVRVTGAGMAESHVHDVTITKEAPNYRRE